jgi:hypothetical protein
VTKARFSVAGIKATPEVIKLLQYPMCPVPVEEDLVERTARDRSPSPYRPFMVI